MAQILIHTFEAKAFDVGHTVPSVCDGCLDNWVTRGCKWLDTCPVGVDLRHLETLQDEQTQTSIPTQPDLNVEDIQRHRSNRHWPTPWDNYWIAFKLRCLNKTFMLKVELDAYYRDPSLLRLKKCQQGSRGLQAPCGVQGQRPCWGSRGRSPLKLLRF